MMHSFVDYANAIGSARLATFEGSILKAKVLNITL